MSCPTQPAVVINAPYVSWVTGAAEAMMMNVLRNEPWNSGLVESMMQGANFWHVTEVIRRSARRAAAANQRLGHVIINCHGSSGALWVGGSNFEPLTLAHVPAFLALRALDSIGAWTTIWLTGASAAQGPSGKAFCAALARASGCRVVANDAPTAASAGFASQVRQASAVLLTEMALPYLLRQFSENGYESYMGNSLNVLLPAMSGAHARHPGSGSARRSTN